MRTWVLSALLVSSAAAANPITVGASLGMTQNEVNANADPDQALSLYGRVELARRVSAQLELGRIDGADQTLQTRTASALGVLDLGGGPLVPIVLAGAGLEDGSGGGGSVSAHHLEAGIGLEYRSRDGLVLGADLRLGDRTIDSDTRPMVLTTWSPPPTLAEGQYRSARVTLGIRF